MAFTKCKYTFKAKAKSILCSDMKMKLNPQAFIYWPLTSECVKFTSPASIWLISGYQGDVMQAQEEVWDNNSHCLCQLKQSFNILVILVQSGHFLVFFYKIKPTKYYKSCHSFAYINWTQMPIQCSQSECVYNVIHFIITTLTVGKCCPWIIKIMLVSVPIDF